MLTAVAFSTCHAKVEVAPDTILNGPAEKRMIRGAVPATTETLTLQVSWPTVLVAVMV
jgi:hypothetical protein